MEAVLAADGSLVTVPSRFAGASGFVAASGRMGKGSTRQREIDTAIREYLEISDLGDVMRNGIRPPEMLVDNWLQLAVLHWFQGHPEDGKSWVVAKLAADIVLRDSKERVLWMDSEMGKMAMAERLHIFGLSPEVVDRQFIHVNLTLLPRAGFEAFREFVTHYMFKLVVWDAMTAHLGAADVKSDSSNTDVAWWIGRLVNPVSQYGGTTVCIDHLTRGGGNDGFALGAGHKKARARVVFQFEKKEPFDRERSGRVLVRCVKNNDAAPIPVVRSVLLGGTPFMFKDVHEPPGVVEDERRERLRADLDAMVKVLGEYRDEHPNDSWLSADTLVTLTPGDNTRLRKLKGDLVDGTVIFDRDLLTYGKRITWRVETHTTRAGNVKETVFFRAADGYRPEAAGTAGLGPVVPGPEGTAEPGPAVPQRKRRRSA